MQVAEKYMQRCFELAQNGLGNVAPNPLVGAVLVCDEKIIGEGYHQKYGEAHAEVNAINSVQDKSKLPAATLYVNLEPCSHFGKTPPCADLIIKSGIKKVVISCTDPNPKIAGKGIEKLKENGVGVQTDFLKEDGEELNKRFFTFHQKKRPYVILKWAQTLDGFMDIDRKTSEKSNHITCPETDRLVHLWRSQEQAVLVGKNTIINDNPQLTVRHVKGRNPIKIVLDSNLELDLNNFQLFKDDTPVFIFNKKTEKQELPIQYFKSNNLKQILSILYENNIQSIIIEGGRKILDSFIAENLWDEARVLIGNKYFKSGLKAPDMNFLPEYKLDFFEDKMIFFRNYNKLGN